MMELLSWNLQGSHLARKALWAHLNAMQEPEVVVCLQEWALTKQPKPQPIDIEVEVQRETAGKFSVASVSLQKKGVALVTLVSQDLVASAPSAQLRACCVTVKQEANSLHPRWQSPLHIVNVHRISRCTEADPGVRRQSMLRFKAEIAAQFPPSTTQGVVMVGDWNAEPFDEEIYHVDVLAASRERIIGAPNQAIMPWFQLYNPCWRLLRDRDDSDVKALQPAGSYYYKDEAKVPNRWKVYDQVILSQDLAARWGSCWSVGLLPALSGHHQLDHGVPTKAVLSDHVPLLVTLPL